QDYAGDVECIVVYDQSEPDDDLASDDPGRAVRVLTNARQPGLAGARNTGILAARGDLVAFCDDDDSWFPEKLRVQVAALEAAPSASVAVTGIVVHYDGRSIPRSPRTPMIEIQDLLVSRVSSAHPSTFLIRRPALIDEIGLVDEEIPGSYGEDYEWLLRAAG